VAEWKDEIRKRLADLNLEPTREAEIVEELAQHLDDRYSELLMRGATHDEATLATLVESSESEMLKRELRRLEGARKHEPVVLGSNRRSNMLGDLWQDMRYSARMLLKNPGFTLVIALSMGLSIGANTTVFTWMESLVINPTPLVKESGSLVAVNSADKDGIGGESDPFSYLTYQDWRNSAQSFEGLIAHNFIRLNLRRPDEPQGEPVWGEIVSGNYFDVLEVPAMLGRTFSVDEEREAARVAVLNYRLWQRLFGGDQNIIGRQFLLNGADVTIIGVGPKGFDGVIAGYGPDMWIPVTLQPLVSQGRNRLNDRNDRWLQGTARLKPGVTLAQAREEMKVMARQVSEGRGEVPITGAIVKRMRERFTGPGFYPLFSALLSVTGLVLLIACANVANLLLARASSRRKEIGIRLALGASRSRIIRQLMIESLALSVLGGLTSILFARWAKDFVVLLSPPTPLPRPLRTEIDGQVIFFALLVTVTTAVIFGLMPAIRASKTDLITTLKEEGRGATGSRTRLRGALIVVQVSMSVVALVCAGLFLRSLQQAQRIEVGISNPDHLLLVGTDLNLAGIKREDGPVVDDQLLERVRGLSGVSFASLSTMVPLGFGGHISSPTKIDGYVPTVDEQVTIERVIVSDGYFETMGIPVVEGREITRQDGANASRIAVVNEAFARRYYPREGPIGKRVDQGQGWSVIVGIAKDAKYRDLKEAPTPVVYSSLQQWYTPAVTLHIRTVDKPKLIAEDVRGALASINANLPFLDPRSMTEHISASTFAQTFGGSMLSAFGALALLIAAAGLYGVLSYVVTLRTREIAIRIIIGATPTEVMALILKQGLTLTLVGLATGSVLALASGRLLQSQLVGIDTSDPLTFLGVAILLVAVALGACYVPARRATKVDPIASLRYE
jgi:macrolide transport system ATP-binding/permease protein